MFFLDAIEIDENLGVGLRVQIAKDEDLAAETEMNEIVRKLQDQILILEDVRGLKKGEKRVRTVNVTETGTTIVTA